MPWAAPTRTVRFDFFSKPADAGEVIDRGWFWNGVDSLMRRWGGRVGHLEVTFESGESTSVIDNGNGVFMKKRRYKRRQWYEHRSMDVSEAVYERMYEFAVRVSKYGQVDANGEQVNGAPFDGRGIYFCKSPIMYKTTGDAGSWWAAEPYANWFCSEYIAEMLYTSGFMDEHADCFEWYLTPTDSDGDAAGRRLYSGQVSPTDLYRALVHMTVAVETEYSQRKGNDMPHDHDEWNAMMALPMDDLPTQDRYGVVGHGESVV